eukprot:sb/3463635/
MVGQGHGVTGMLHLSIKVVDMMIATYLPVKTIQMVRHISNVTFSSRIQFDQRYFNRSTSNKTFPMPTLILIESLLSFRNLKRSHRKCGGIRQYPTSGLVENFCRNPDGWTGTWCYRDVTPVNQSRRYDDCDVPTCENNPNGKTYRLVGGQEVINPRRYNIISSFKKDEENLEILCSGKNVTSLTYNWDASVAASNRKADVSCIATVDTKDNGTLIFQASKTVSAESIEIKPGPNSYALKGDVNNITCSVTYDTFDEYSKFGITALAFNISLNGEFQKGFNCSLNSDKNSSCGSNFSSVSFEKEYPNEGRVEISCLVNALLDDGSEEKILSTNAVVNVLKPDDFSYVMETRTWDNPGLDEESMKCTHAQYKPGVYMCPGDSGGVYQVLDTSGGTCVFDKKCAGDDKSYQACGCPLISIITNTTAETLEIQSTVCEDMEGNIISVWTDNLCDGICLCANCEDEQGPGCEKDSSSKSKDQGFTCNDIYKTTISLNKKCDGKASCRNSMTTVTLSDNVTLMVYNFEDEYECYKTQLPGDYVDYCTVTPLR